jgi:hypothetical protein
MTDMVQDGTSRTRRSVLAAAAGGAAALAVSAIRPGTATAGVLVAMNIEVDNATTATTSITDSTAGNTAFVVNAATNGTGIKGTSVSGKALLGISSDGSDPETNVEQAGVVGVAGDVANAADNFGLSGIYGWADGSPVDGFVGTGVWGDSADIGVVGTGSIGVYGAGSLGLLVDGRAAFSRSGRSTIGSGNAKKAVNLSGVTASSLVFAVLAQNRSGRYVRAVVPESGKFTIYLNQAVGSDTKVSWIVFTNPGNLSG